MNKQEAKADAGKPRPTLVPVEAEKAIMYVREFGCMKYGDPDNWKRVEPSRYLDAALRHIMAYREDHNALDEESSLPPLWHALNDLAFIVALEWDEDFQRAEKSAHVLGKISHINLPDIVVGHPDPVGPKPHLSFCPKCGSIYLQWNTEKGCTECLDCGWEGPK